MPFSIPLLPQAANCHGIHCVIAMPDWRDKYHHEFARQWRRRWERRREEAIPVLPPIGWLLSVPASAGTDPPAAG